MSQLSEQLGILKASLEGELYSDEMMRRVYATDASVYRDLPLAVAMPKGAEDIRQLIHFARSAGTSLIPRTAGTSLAGQCVGDGIVVDTSRYLTQILEVNPDEGWVRVQPGVVRDELNHHLKPYGLFFGPNTSTANRAMIGGMVGNNSCGSYSIVYGTTRDHVLELRAILSDGSEAVFGPLSPASFEAKCALDSLEGAIYRQIRDELSDPQKQQQIREGFPAPAIHRRNTGYAVDTLLAAEIFTPRGEDFNFCKLLAGSEGTLAFITEIKIHVDPLPPAHTGLLCAHFHSVSEALKAVLIAMEHQPRAVELMDKIIMDCTKENLLYQKNRFFLQGDPEAVLIIEAGGETFEEVEDVLSLIARQMEAQGLGYHFPTVFGPNIHKVWDLRKAGLGLLSNVPGDAKPVAVIEDTAVRVQDLPAYIDEFTAMMEGFGQRAVYYAHAGAGELHLRPLLNLKLKKDVDRFHEIGKATAELVKKYKGSLSGEHGDGRVRAEFIPMMVGEENYQLFRRIKGTWDPKHIFNPGKIVDAPPMNAQLRFEPDEPTRQFETFLDFSDTDGILRAVEKCNGSADCRKSHLSGGTMCPSYMATRDEKDTTRARANVLREFLTRSTHKNPFSHEEIYEIMDLCLACKGCTSECPSNVDMTTLKAEFLHQYYKTHGVPMRARAFAGIPRINRLFAPIAGLNNFMLHHPLTSKVIKQVLGFAPQRKVPGIYRQTLRKWYKKHRKALAATATEAGAKGKLYFFCDEFINYNDVPIGITALKLMAHLGYEAILLNHGESGRTYLSKGLLHQARQLAVRNVTLFKDKVNAEMPLVGIEPSAILTFRDEYKRLVPEELKAAAKALAPHALLIDDFLFREVEKGHIHAGQFHAAPRKIKLHGHCHQKALDSTDPTVHLLALPENYEVEEIPSGCCGMAGSFGYEKEHYELSMQIGELVLFPRVREAGEETLIAAPGTSCRHQIADGTGRKALHPVEILWEALAK